MAPTSGPVSGAGTADTQQLYGSTASVFWWRPAATGFAALAIALCFWWRPAATGFAGLAIALCFWWRPAATGFAGLAIALCFWGRPAGTGFADLAIATKLLVHDWPPGRDRDARRRGPPARNTTAVCRRPRCGARRRCF